MGVEYQMPIFFEYQVWEFYNNKNTQIRTFHYFL